MRSRLIAIWIGIVMLAGNAQAQEWSKYVPEKQRKDIIKKAMRASGIGAALKSGMQSFTLWVTEPVACALVSSMIDHGRLTGAEADERYRKLRPVESYLLAVFTSVVDPGNPLFSPRSAGEAVDPLDPAALFIQRADDRKVFSKGTITEQDFDVSLSGIKPQTLYVISFPRYSRDEQPIGRSLADKLELQYHLGPKKVILDYKIKDLVARLEDL